VKTWDAIVIGGGVIGLSVALELTKRSVKVLVIERSETGREASHAAGGMLAHCDPHTPEVIRPLASASAAMYPEFVHELQDETRAHVDLRQQGTIAFLATGEAPICGKQLSDDELEALEPLLASPGIAHLLPEACLDPRGLVAALATSLHHRAVDIVTGSTVVSVEVEDHRVTGVRTEKSRYHAPVAINCAGAWSTDIPPVPLRTSPVKGQMLSIVPAHGSPHFSLKHVVRSGNCYLIPRSDGRIVIGATVEYVGFDKRVDPDVIQRLHQEAANLLPELGEGRILEAWAGLRPGTPDGLPMIGETSYGGYLAATGHYRDGILLAPVTARIIAQLATGENPEINLLPFAPERFR
jgi:glycine oxidase